MEFNVGNFILPTLMANQCDTGEGERVFSIVNDLVDRLRNVEIVIGENHNSQVQGYRELFEKHDKLLSALCEHKAEVSLVKETLHNFMKQHKNQTEVAMRDIEIMIKNIGHIIKEKGIEPLEEFGPLNVEKTQILGCENRPGWWMTDEDFTELERETNC
jgi:hypothetical protein